MRIPVRLSFPVALMGASLAAATAMAAPQAEVSVASDPALPLVGFNPIRSIDLVQSAAGLRRVVIPAPQDVDYLYLHFKDIVATSSDLKLEIRNSSGLVAAWDASDLAHRQTLLSPQLPAEDTTVLVRGNADPASLTFTLDAIHVQASKPAPTSLSPIFDYVPVIKTKPDNPVRLWARGVVKLTISSKGYLCTGFLVAADLVVTNHHCVALSEDFDKSTATDRPCSDISFAFDYLETKYSTAKPAPACKAVIDWEPAPVDLALIRLQAAPATPPGVSRILKPATSVTADPASDAAEPFQRVDLVAHPQGSRMKVSQGCLLYIKAKAGKLDHVCTTLGGSSGSPLLNGQGEVVAVHSNGWVRETASGLEVSTEYDRLCDLMPCPPRNTATPADSLRAFLARPH